MTRSATFKSLLTAVPFVVYAALSIDAAQDDRARTGCSQAPNGAVVCENDAVAALQRELGRLLVLASQGPDMSPASVQSLVEAQREWVRDRNECWKARDQERCVVEQYAKRIHQLREAYADARTDDWAGISTGPLEVRCDALGPPARLTYVRGDLDVAYLELPHTRLVLTGRATGSGSEYVAQTAEGEFVFSPRGSDATLERPGAAEDVCRIEGGDEPALALAGHPT